MTPFEKSAIIGYYRNGMTFQEIALLIGISTEYVEIIITEYLKAAK